MNSNINEIKLKKFWNNKKVLITGHTGFKGSWLSLILNHYGAKIIGYSLKCDDEESLFNLIKIKSILKKNIYSDIRNFKKLGYTINKYKPDVIFHLAAQSIVSESYFKPLYNYDVNIVGSVNLLEILRFYKKKITTIIVTTDKVYKYKKNLIYSEENIIGGDGDPYSTSKACIELIVSSYIKSFFKKNNNIKIATARSGNVIGGGDFSKDRLVPDIFKRKRKLIIRNPNFIRPWQHVIEPLFGYMFLAEKIHNDKIKFRIYSSGWNFGPKKSNFKSVINIVKFFLKKNEYKILKKKRIHESDILKLNSKKSEKYLKWNSFWNLDQSLKKTKDWYTAYKNNNDLIRLSIKQIKEFVKRR